MAIIIDKKTMTVKIFNPKAYIAIGLLYIFAAAINTDMAVDTFIEEGIGFYFIAYSNLASIFAYYAFRYLRDAAPFLVKKGAEYE